MNKDDEFFWIILTVSLIMEVLVIFYICTYM